MLPSRIDAVRILNVREYTAHNTASSRPHVYLRIAIRSLHLACKSYGDEFCGRLTLPPIKVAKNRSGKAHIATITTTRECHPRDIPEICLNVLFRRLVNLQLDFPACRAKIFRAPSKTLPRSHFASITFSRFHADAFFHRRALFTIRIRFNSPAGTR